MTVRENRTVDGAILDDLTRNETECSWEISANALGGLFKYHQEETSNHSKNTHGLTQAKLPPEQAGDICEHVYRFCGENVKTPIHILGQCAVLE